MIPHDPSNDTADTLYMSPAAFALLMADADVKRRLRREEAEQNNHQTHVTLRYERPPENRKQRRARMSKGRKA